MKTLLWLFSFLLSVSIWAQEVLPLWPEGVPNAKIDAQFLENTTTDVLGAPLRVSQVSVPTLTAFVAAPEKATGAAVLICPGGGYKILAINKEGYRIAKWLNTLGISAFVLKNRLPDDRIMEDKSIGPLQDAQQGLRIIRKHAEKWNIDPQKIGVLGFSAGGHLAASLSTHYDQKVYEASEAISARPDFSILIYPVISMQEGLTHGGSRTNLLGATPSPAQVDWFSNEKQINAQTPPALLIHSVDDGAVLIENSISYLQAMKKQGVPVELHAYRNGGHGFGLGLRDTHKYWSEACENWLVAMGLAKSKKIMLFSYFMGNGEDGLHLASSEDGLHFERLKNTSWLTPQVGKDKLMRDPNIIQGPDGKFHMVWTVSWTDQGIGYAHSEDLIHWSEQKFIPVMQHQPKTRNTWAPEITYDPQTENFYIYWSSTIAGTFLETQPKGENGYNHRIYYTKTKDFSNFAPTQLLLDPGFNVIDASIQFFQDKYILFLKDETPEPPAKNIKWAYADTFEGPYSKPSTPISGDYWAEGPTSLYHEGQWTVYFDKYRKHAFGAVQSSDLNQWKDISDQISFPEGARHGSIFWVDRTVYEALQNHAQQHP